MGTLPRPAFRSLPGASDLAGLVHGEKGVGHLYRIPVKFGQAAHEFGIVHQLEYFPVPLPLLNTDDQTEQSSKTLVPS